MFIAQFPYLNHSHVKVCEVEKIECEQLTSLINVLETVLVTSSDDLSDYDQQN